LDRICLSNGILNVKTLKLQPHTPAWLSPIQLPITYDPTADCPELDAFFESALPSDVYQAEVPYQLLALLMIPYTSAQRAVPLQGPRGTGKSRFLALIRAFLGPANTSSQSLHTLEENRFALSLPGWEIGQHLCRPT
jgi:putative DNA primase/helicase